MFFRVITHNHKNRQPKSLATDGKSSERKENINVRNNNAGNAEAESAGQKKSQDFRSLRTSRA
ncbi:hypothetical protein CT0287 [Chlorobaculum tepidum TLS]|uniref:Uncharacterized protein n=1 Tax=Chlorobaculum tepidum (strain ATCC 49652 / DSM 12025 / NBRC 103806 / TLS) TaxID=194439 RepID=Q8KFN5_CHLTE|nr:hypothetical protein CT0287 [Chlorobaculum tepidum TLS]